MKSKEIRSCLMKAPIPFLYFLGLLTGILTSPCQGQTPSSQGPAKIIISRADSQPTQPGPPNHFTGAVRIETPFPAHEPARAGGASVTFEPGARTAWHTHPLGQTLIVTAGMGWVQGWGDPVQEIHRGDVVWIPAGTMHWHGATTTTAMTHLAVAEAQDGKAVDWLEKVTDEQYARGQSDAPEPQKQIGANTMNKEPSAAQKAMGDIDPKLAQLTDDVLFGDVWARPELSKRDRSLVTVSALIAGGNTEQLRSHLKLAKENGVTEAELVETFTHLAFYCGWPRAVSAITVAREVFKPQP